MVASVCLSLSHISEDTEAVVEAGESSVGILRMTMTILPIAGLLIAVFVFAKKYMLTDEKLQEINEQLQARH
jgi:melibiose permease